MCKTYGEGDNAHHALRNVNLTINDGDVFGIIGASGAGKSTLVRCLNLLERPTDGAILYDGRDITGLSGRALLELRSQVGMIFQNFSLFQQRTVLRNVTFPLELRGEKGETARKRAMELLELVGLADLAQRYPSQLSGGQQQRVAIARALANNPKVMLCDEATSALDTRTTASILQAPAGYQPASLASRSWSSPTRCRGLQDLQPRGRHRPWPHRGGGRHRRRVRQPAKPRHARAFGQRRYARGHRARCRRRSRRVKWIT